MTAPKLTPDTPATRRAFNRLAREKMKLRLLADIRMDLMVCELEGWDKLEYLDELLVLVQELRKGGGGEMLTEKQMERIATTKQSINDLFIAQGLTYGEVKRVLWQLIHEFKRKEEKYLNESSIT